MESTQVTEVSKKLYFSIRVINAVPTVNHKDLLKIKPKVRVLCNLQRWEIKPQEVSYKKLSYHQTHTFELYDIFPITIQIFKKNFLYNEQIYGECTVKSVKYKQTKKVGWVEVTKQGEKVADLLLGYLFEDERHPKSPNYEVRVNEVELEKEEVKFHKNQVKKKHSALKSQIKVYKKLCWELFGTNQRFKQTQGKADLNEEISNYARKNQLLEKELQNIFKVKQECLVSQTLQKSQTDSNLSYLKRSPKLNIRLRNSKEPQEYLFTIVSQHENED